MKNTITNGKHWKELTAHWLIQKHGSATWVEIEEQKSPKQNSKKEKIFFLK